MSKGGMLKARTTEVVSQSQMNKSLGVIECREKGLAANRSASPASITDFMYCTIQK